MVARTERLTGRQLAFVEFFVGECMGVAVEAARMAGYGSVHGNASRLMDNPRIKAAIARRTSDRAMKADQVLGKLSDIARADIGDFTKLVGLTSQAAITAEMERLQGLGVSWLIKKLTPTKHGLSVELHDAQAALTTLARYHGLLVDRVRISPDIDWDALSPEQLERIAEGKGL